MNLNNENWKYLIELYDNISLKTPNVTVTNEPVRSYFSKDYGWPNFTMISDLGMNRKEQISMINQLIMEKKLSPFILLHPDLHGDEEIVNLLDAHDIRLMNQWPLIYYDFDWGIQKEFDTKDFHIEIVRTDSQFESWHDIVSKVLLNNSRLPIDGFKSKEYCCLLGYENDVPVATTMVYCGTDATIQHHGAVLPEYRQKGYGKQIHRQAFIVSQEMNYRLAYAQSSRMGLSSWLSLGFRITGHLNFFWKVGYMV